MDDVRRLDVRLDRLTRWHTDGLLCIGDAAHAMFPVGGMGIGLAIQDAVAAATMLAGPLIRGRPTPRQLARVRRRRLLPTVLTQTVQRVMHADLAHPMRRGQPMGPPGPYLRFARHVPGFRILAAYLVGIGVRPSRVPGFARARPSAR